MTGAAWPRTTAAQLLGLIALPVLAMLGWVAWLCIGLAMDMCGNQLIADVPLHSGRYHAVVFQHDCGATTGFSTQVSILPAGRQLRDGDSGVFVSIPDKSSDANTPAERSRIRLRWQDNGSLWVSDGERTMTVWNEN